MSERGTGGFVFSISLLLLIGLFAALGAPVSDDPLPYAIEPEPGTKQSRLIPPDFPVESPTDAPEAPTVPGRPIFNILTDVVTGLFGAIPSPAPLFAFIFNFIGLYAAILAEGNVFVKVLTAVPAFIVTYNVVYTVYYFIKDVIPTT